MSRITNRPEIDGLRALAVIPVVLYHTALGIPGGYVGVDVFFVISGYLITSLILADISEGKFQVTNFWERRARRILPTLALVVFACIAAGWFRLLPSDFDEFGRSVVYQALLISNVFFWRSTQYFSSNDTEPLLHTWSLAVEEQFYILFPFLLLALKKFRPRVLAGTLSGIAAVSLSWCIFETLSQPTAAFYLLPFRAWELLLGSVLATVPKIWPRAKWQNESLSLAGLASILFAILVYDNTTQFPGFAALLPCLGAGLIIWTNSPTLTWVGWLLSRRPCVFVGLISYSLYLWHWPVLVFVKYWSASELTMVGSLGIVVVSLLLAATTWKLVETPFRKRVFLRNRLQIVVFSGVVFATLLIAGRWIHRSGGVRSRWRSEALQYIDGKNDKDFRVELEFAQAKRVDLTEIGYKGNDRPVDLLIWGDSHAMAVLHVLDVICAKVGIRALAATHSATAPLLDFPSTTRFSLKEETIPYNWVIANLVKERQIKNVLLAAAWNGYASPTETQSIKNKFEESWVKTIDFLRNAGAKVFILKDVPKQSFDVPRVLAAAAESRRDPSGLGSSTSDYRAQGAYANGVLDKLASNSVVLLDPADILTDKTAVCRTSLNGKALYFDDHHLSIYGAMLLSPMFDKILLENISR